MLRWIVETSIKLRFLIIVLAAMLFVFGVAQLRQMPVAAFPEVDPPHVEVQTEALGLSAEEVEAFVTVPMEADLLNGVAWLDKIYSESVAGLSSILMIFEPGTDPIRARQMVQERLTQAHALPNVSSPPLMLQPLSSTNRALMVGLSSDELSPIEMGVLSRWIIKPRLLGVPGVANVAIWGQRERQLQVQVDPAELHARGVSLSQVIESAGEALWVSPLTYLQSSAPGTAGWIDTPNQRLSIRHLLPISTPDELARVVVAGNADLTLGDISSVVEDHQPLIGDAALQDGPGYLLVIEKFPGANTVEVTRGVEEALAALQPGLQGMEIDTGVFRPANYIESSVSNISTLLLIGAVLVALVLFLFYFQWRTTLISLIVIPLSLIAAGMVLLITGATFNLMILAGLAVALGVIIDNAIVDVESVAQRLRRGREEGSDELPASIILETIVEMRGTLGFALFIILLAILPIFFFSGGSTPFFEPLATSYVVAILASLLVALIVTPALSVSLLSGASLRRESPVATGLQRFYGGLLARTVKAPYVALVVAGVLIVIGLVALPMLDLEVLPSLEERDLLVEFEAAPGTSRPAMNRIMAQATSELQAIPGVRDIGSHIGRAITGDSVVGINSGELWISLDPAADYDATVASIRGVVAGYPGLKREVKTYQPERRTTQVLTGPDKDVVVRIYGHELDVLSDKAQEVALALAEIDGIDDAQPVLYAQEPQVEVEVDLAAAEQNGIKPGDIRRQATILLSGIQVGSLFEEQKVFDVIVWGVPELRSNLTNISELLIDKPDGTQVTLGEVADVRVAPAATVIQRDAVSRFVDVGANVSGRSLKAVTADVQSRLEGVSVPFEYHMEMLQDTQDQGAGNGLLGLLPVAIAVVIGIYLLMQASFGSWSLAFVVLLTLPMALVGGVLAVLIGGGVLSIGALFGFFAVLAIAVRNGVVMVNHLRRQVPDEAEAEQGSASDMSELVVRGARERLVPILMTVLAMAGILLPTLIAGGIAGNEISAPMAAVVLGGLVTTTLLNLFIVPALYLRWPSALPAASSPQSSPQPSIEAA
jgi:CzcA family heavy metal efflux pump